MSPCMQISRSLDHRHRWLGQGSHRQGCGWGDNWIHLPDQRFQSDPPQGSWPNPYIDIHYRHQHLRGSVVSILSQASRNNSSTAASPLTIESEKEELKNLKKVGQQSEDDVRVGKWVIKMRALIVFLTKSRLIVFLYNLVSLSLTILILKGVELSNDILVFLFIAMLLGRPSFRSYTSESVWTWRMKTLGSCF